MLTAILITAFILLLGVLSHRHSRLENRIYKNVPLNDWLLVLILPVSLYLCWFFMVKNILSRPNIGILPLDDFDILAISILFMIYGFVGNGIHFTGKILWRYLQTQRRSIAFKINEMFHGKLSHYLVYLNFIFILFTLPIFEINHPMVYGVTNQYLLFIAIGGMIFGIACSKAIFYTNEWFGGYNKPLFYVVSILLIFILIILNYFQLRFAYYPIYLFTFVTGGSFISTFILRQLFIFTSLGNRRRLRFLAKMLSA